MTRLWVIAVLLAATPLSVARTLQPASCPANAVNRAALLALKDAKFEVAQDAERQVLAVSLLSCLADPDPLLRDGVAFEAYATWLRTNKLTVATRTEMFYELSDMLTQPPDASGFRQPFAALVLSEVARTDRIAAWLSKEQRAQLVSQAIDYVTGVRDYRGFSNGEGWRHGVAHGADLLMQLALNPAVERQQVDAILQAVASQVAPAGEHSYIHGESERLARVWLVAAQRGLYTAEEWTALVEKVSAPAPLTTWGDAFTSRAGLAKRHNVKAFVYALYVNAAESSNAGIQTLLPGTKAALKLIP